MGHRYTAEAGVAKHAREIWFQGDIANQIYSLQGAICNGNPACPLLRAINKADPCTASPIHLLPIQGKVPFLLNYSVMEKILPRASEA